ASPLAGRLMAATRTGTASAAADGDVAIAAFTLDAAGNVGGRATAVLAAAGEEADPPPGADAVWVADLRRGGYAYDAGNARIWLTGDASSLMVHAAYGRSREHEITLGGPSGAPLRVGHYANAADGAFDAAGRPVLDLVYAATSSGCDAGSFDVRRLATEPGGRVRELWVTFDACGRLGEIRLGFRPDPADRFVLPSVAAWPKTFPGAPGSVEPVTLRNTGREPMTVAAVRVAGANGGDWSVRDDTCTGAALAPQEQCVVGLRFAPAVGGPRYGRLELIEPSGRRTTVPLEGTAARGRTRVLIDAEPGFWGESRRVREYTPATAVISGAGGRGSRGAWVRVQPADEDSFDVRLGVPEGQTLSPGRYVADDSAGSPELGVSRSLDCGGGEVGEFTVRTTGPERVDASLVARCRYDEDGPALRASLEYQVPFGDVRAPAPVSGLAARREGGLIRLAWTNPADADWVTTVVRRMPGTAPPPSPLAGVPVFASRAAGGSLFAAGPQAFAVFALDRAGNLSRRVVATVR
ncbi:MAG TPA: hypothetical protein VF533_07145, partial [Solirubrobacteraceae bacterium]